jgi:ribosomal protein S18 acetylase RimI-like enzyme
MIDSFTRVRPAELTDASALTQLHRDSWELAYRGIIPDRQLRVTLANHDEQWWQRRLHANAGWLLVLMAGDRLAGYCSLGRARSGSPVKGEIFELYLEPAHQGLGLGAQLFEAARTHLDSAGLDGLLVWVLTANEPAVAFYQARGGIIMGTAEESFGSVRVQKTALLWR